MAAPILICRYGVEIDIAMFACAVVSGTALGLFPVLRWAFEMP
jgi:hypothetical protein